MSSILIIDDSSIVCKHLEKQFNREGIDVLFGYSALEALDVIKSYEPSLIILDLCLHDIHGITFLETIRKSNNMIPVYILTASDNPSEILECMKLGASGVYKKDDLSNNQAFIKVVVEYLAQPI